MRRPSRARTASERRGGAYAGRASGRALGDPDALPAADIVLRRMAAVGGPPLTAKELEQRAEAWRPWRSYAVMHLWRAAGDETQRKADPFTNSTMDETSTKETAP